MYYQRLFNDFVHICQRIIGQELIGIYLHGSLTMNCFNPRQSDIDIIVVIKKDLTDQKKRMLMDNIVWLNTKAPAKGLEISVVKEEYCRSFIYPTPFELHFSMMHLQSFYNDPIKYIETMKGKDKDLAAHFTMIRKCGIALFGKPVLSVFEEVPQEYFIDSLWQDVKNAKEDIYNNPVYMILNLCRFLAFLKDGCCLSKKEGCEWALKNISQKYHTLVLEAFKTYQKDQEFQCNNILLMEFVEVMLLKIEKEIHRGKKNG